MVSASASGHSRGIQPTVTKLGRITQGHTTWSGAAGGRGCAGSLVACGSAARERDGLDDAEPACLHRLDEVGDLDGEAGNERL